MDRKPTLTANSSRILATAALLASLGEIPTASADENEWWEQNRYYEKDGWFDITEWFDGNDYNPTDEKALRWDDEIYDRSLDKDLGSNDGWDWDYDYDSRGERSQQAKRPSPSTSSRDEHELRQSGSDSRHGFDTRYDPDNWFYDTWDDGYSAYRDADDDGNYEFTYTYFDLDGDGRYDAFYSYYDRDGDGIYDTTDPYLFTHASDHRNEGGQPDPGPATRQEVPGTIESIKKVSVRDTKHWVVTLRNEEGQSRLADLGPVSQLNLSDLQEGEDLVVRGPLVPAGDKRILIAQELERDGKQAPIVRDSQFLQGTVADTRTMNVRGAKHLLGILATGQERKTLVDFGFANRLDINIENGDRIRVKGVPVTVGDRKVLMAHQLGHDGQTILIDRSQNRSEPDASAPSTQTGDAISQDSRPSRASSERTARQDDLSARGQVTGDVLWKKQIMVRGHKRQTVTVENRDGQRYLIDLGPAGEMNLTVRQGDRVTAYGNLVKARNGESVVAARRVKINGRTADLEPGETRRGDRATQTVTGKVASMRKTTVRNQTRQLAEIESDRGTSLTVDFGSPRGLDLNLKKGDRVTVDGITVKSGEEVVLMAKGVTRNDGERLVIRRRSAPGVTAPPSDEAEGN